MAHNHEVAGSSPAPATKDMLPAKEAGMKTVLIANDPSSDDMQNADAVVSDVKTISDLL